VTEFKSQQQPNKMTNVWNITNKIINEYCHIILLWFYTMNQVHIKHAHISVWIECSVKEGKLPLSISGEHEFKQYSANCKFIYFEAIEENLSISASRRHFLLSHQTHLQSNFSFMSCLWRHLRKVCIQLKSSPITIPMTVWLQWH
jgi:hypothetical protein